MKKSMAWSVIVCFFVGMVGLTGCFSSGPSDAEVIESLKIITSQAEADPNIRIISPLQIVERGSRTSEGFWPVKVKYTVMKDSEKRDISMIVWFNKAQDSMGKSIWQFKLADIPQVTAN